MLGHPVPQISSREGGKTWPRLRAAWTWTSWWGCWWPGRQSGKRHVPGKCSASRAVVYCSCCRAKACLQRDLQWIIQFNSINVRCAILLFYMEHGAFKLFLSDDPWLPLRMSLHQRLFDYSFMPHAADYLRKLGLFTPQSRAWHRVGVFNIYSSSWLSQGGEEHQGGGDQLPGPGGSAGP